MQQTGWLLALVVMLAGCAAKPGGNWVGSNLPSDVGTLPAGWQGQVDTIIKSRLRDPYSVVIDIGTPVVTSCRIGLYDPFHGWAVPVTYNAKNLYGAYTGAQYRVFWYANGTLKRESWSMEFCDPTTMVKPQSEADRQPAIGLDLPSSGFGGSQAGLGREPDTRPR